MPLKQVETSTSERAEKLEATRWSNQFNWQQLCSICEVMTLHEASAGDLLFEQGAADTHMGLLIKGRLRIDKTAEDGHSMTIAQVLASQSFGEMSLIDGEPRSANIIADTDVQLLLLDRPGINKLVELNPKLGFDLLWNIAYLLSQRLRKTSGGLMDQKQGSQ